MLEKGHDTLFESEGSSVVADFSPNSAAQPSCFRRLRRAQRSAIRTSDPRSKIRIRVSTHVSSDKSIQNVFRIVPFIIFILILPFFLLRTLVLNYSLRMAKNSGFDPATSLPNLTGYIVLITGGHSGL
jgi:hypothetical protein